MSRYSGLLANLEYFFLHYFTLSDPAAFAAVVSGIVVTILFIVLLFVRFERKYLNALVILALLPLFVGVAGTISTISSTREAARIENKNGNGSSAKKYYDLEYVYSRSLLQSFPTLAGAAGSLLPVILLVPLRRRILKKDE